VWSEIEEIRSKKGGGEENPSADGQRLYAAG